MTVQDQAALVTPPLSTARSAGAISPSPPSLYQELDSTPSQEETGEKSGVPITRPRSAGGSTNANKRTPALLSKAPKSAPRVLRGPTPSHLRHPHQPQRPQGMAPPPPTEKKQPVTAAQLRAKHAEDRLALRQFMNQVKQQRREQGEAKTLMVLDIDVFSSWGSPICV